MPSPAEQITQFRAFPGAGNIAPWLFQTLQLVFIARVGLALQPSDCYSAFSCATMALYTKIKRLL